nr:phospholipase-like protein [Tanacetum cinerariifolium]
SPLSGGHTPRSDAGSMTLKELTNLCTTLSQKVLDLEKVKTAHAKEVASLKKRVTKLEQRQSSRISGFHPFRASTFRRHSLEVIVKDKGNGEKRGNTAETVSTARPDISAARPEMKSQKAKEKGVAFKDVNDSTRPIRSITTLQPLPTIDPKDEGKGILQEPEHVKKTKKRDQDQIERDDEVALKIQAVLDEEFKTKRERHEEASKAALAGLYDEVLKKMKRELEVERKELRVQVQNKSHIRSRRHFLTFSRMLEVLDRQDVLDLHKIMMERFLANDPEEKRYPLTKEILKKMLSWRLEAEIKSTLALDLIKYIKLQIEEKTSEIQGISFVMKEGEEDSSETLPCQLPPKEMNLGSFTFPCTIGNLKLYVMADLGAGVNVMPKSIFEHLKLADLKETNMVVEMADMTKKALLGIELEGSQDDEVGSHLLENVVSRWHVCKPVRITFVDCEKDCGQDNSFEEWVKIKLGHTNISETIKCEIFKEWIKENFNFEVDFRRTHDDPYSRRFDVYKEEFDNEIEQLVNEYELKTGRKRYALDEVWEKCEKFHDTSKLWYDKGFEEEEL